MSTIIPAKKRSLNPTTFGLPKGKRKRESTAAASMITNGSQAPAKKKKTRSGRTKGKTRAGQTRTIPQLRDDAVDPFKSAEIRREEAYIDNLNEAWQDSRGSPGVESEKTKQQTLCDKIAHYFGESP